MTNAIPPEVVAHIAATAVKASTGQVTPTTYTTGGILLLIIGYFARNFVPFLNRQDARTDAYTARQSADIERLEAQITGLQGSVKEALTASHRAQTQMTYLTAAFSMVCSELERHDPSNTVLKQARDLVAQATLDSNIFGPFVRQLNDMKGTGE